VKTIKEIEMIAKAILALIFAVWLAGSVCILAPELVLAILDSQMSGKASDNNQPKED
jgi:hypothetical protein